MRRPTLRLLVLHTAVGALVEPPVKVAAPQLVIVLPPSVKATVPVGAEPATVAVNVTLVPTVDGLSELCRMVVVGDGFDKPKAARWFAWSVA